MNKDDKVDWNNQKYIEEICKSAVNRSDACRKLNLTPAANIRTLNKYIKKYNINIDHFDPHAHKRHGWKLCEKTPLSVILIENSSFNTGHLKKRLLDENIFENICGECGQLPVWNNKKLNMQLDHENGIGNDNRKENLRFLCPNCHTQTPTYAGRNKNKGKK